MQKFFLPLVFVFCAIALIYPESFSWGKHYIPYMLGLVMFGMGATLATKDFVDVVKNWKVILFGVSAHYTIMPLMAVLIGIIFQLPTELYAGLVLVGCCPAGTASNLMAYIARGNLALSVTMTLVSTFISPILTPFIFLVITSKIIHISYWEMVSDVFWIIIFPLIDGLIVRQLFQNAVKKVIPYLPGFSLFVIAIIISVVFSVNQKMIIMFPILVIIAVIIHNVSGYGIGYAIGKVFNLEEKDRRSVAIEIGMQNSGLGAALALGHLGGQFALPSAIFSLWQNISGSILAKFWSKKD